MSKQEKEYTQLLYELEDIDALNGTEMYERNLERKKVIQKRLKEIEEEIEIYNK